LARTLTEKILDAHRLGVDEGLLRIGYDHLLLHDATGALLMKRFGDLGRGLKDPSRILAAADHFVPPATAERAEILQEYLAFIEGLPGIRRRPFEGICHQVLVEDPATGPGQVIIGADSHTVMAGALGCLAAGFGSTDILFAMISGWIWIPPPTVWRLEITGRPGPWIRGKDCALSILRKLGQAPAGPDLCYECLDLTSPPLGMDSRFALSCMGAEMGAAFFTIVPDEVTRDYVEAKGGTWEEGLRPDAGARYARRVEVRVPDRSLVAAPPAPWCVEDIDGVAGIRIDQAFVGSCTGGRLEDIADTAAVLSGRRVARNVRLIVIPASRKTYLDALSLGYLETIVRAGGMVGIPSCGPCGGIDKGITGRGQVMISTANRNFPGRTGRGDCYLASAPVAAASAVTGRITAPEEVLS
jgi:homoaconitase/3-isopropylmalate dehydratase large subunit